MKQLNINSFTKLILLGFFLATLLVSCIKDGDLDFENIKMGNRFTYDLPLPLVSTSLTLEEMLKSVDMIKPDDQGLLHLIYADEWDVKTNFHDFTLPNQQLQFSPSSYIPIYPVSVLNVDSVVKNFSSQHTLTLSDDLQIDSANIANGQMRITINSNIRSAFRLDFNIPWILDPHGKPLSVPIRFESSTSGSQYQSVNIDISSHALRWNSKANGVHQSDFSIKAVIYKDTTLQQTYDGILVANIELSSIQMRSFLGYIGKRTFEIQDQMPLPIFHKFPMEMLDIEQANLKLQINNGLSIPSLLRNSIVVASPTGSKPYLGIDSVIQLPYPKPSESERDTIISGRFEDLIQFDKGNMPSAFILQHQFTFNPDNDLSHRNWISESSFARMSFRAEIPMRLRFSQLLLSDTINSPGSLPPSNGIDFLVLKANVHNAFPVSIRAYLLLLDSTGHTLDSIWIGAVPGAPTDAQTGHVIHPSVRQLEINLNRSQIEHLTKASHMVVHSVLSTSNYEQQKVSFYVGSDKEGFVKILIGARIQVNANIENVPI